MITLHSSDITTSAGVEECNCNGMARKVSLLCASSKLALYCLTAVVMYPNHYWRHEGARKLAQLLFLYNFPIKNHMHFGIITTWFVTRNVVSLVFLFLSDSHILNLYGESFSMLLLLWGWVSLQWRVCVLERAENVCDCRAASISPCYFMFKTFSPGFLFLSWGQGQQ